MAGAARAKGREVESPKALDLASREPSLLVGGVGDVGNVEGVRGGHGEPNTRFSPFVIETP